MTPSLSPRPRSARGWLPPAGWIWLLPASFCAFLAANCVIVSGKRLLGADELITYYPVAAPFRAMLSSTTDTINASPPLYFIVAWIWAHVFGDSALSLRLLSTLAAVFAILVLFAVVKRVFGGLAAAAALPAAVIEVEFMHQCADARYYTLELAEFSLALFIYQRMMQRRPSAGLLVASAAVNACLVMTHYFGMIYSGVLFAAVVVTGLLRRQNTARPALSIAAGWLVFLPWIPVFQRHVQMGKPTFWIYVPSFGDLLDFFAHYLTADSRTLALLLGVLAAAALALLLAQPGKLGPRASRLLSLHRREVPLLVLVPLLALVPVGIYFISTRPGAISSFLDRYMVPGAFGWAILCAFVANRVFTLGSLATRRGAARILPLAAAAAVVLFVAVCDAEVLQSARAERVQVIPPKLPAAVPASEPIIVITFLQFMPEHYYSGEPERYLFLVNHAQATRQGRASPSDHMIMEALRRQFPEEFKEVMPSEEFYAHASSYWIKMARLDLDWARLPEDPRFAADFMIPSLWLVHLHHR